MRSTSRSGWVGRAGWKIAALPMCECAAAGLRHSRAPTRRRQDAMVCGRGFQPRCGWL